MKGWFVLLLVLVFGGCAAWKSTDMLEEFFGPGEPRERMVAADSAAGQTYLSEVKPILEQRCVVCHGCYDSPCQLNLSTPDGIDRGASKDKVYNAARLKEAPLTRLLVDAQTTGEWRDMGFWPVLNDHDQTEDNNLQASILHHMLMQKREYPLPEEPILDEKVFDLGLNRKQECPKPEELEDFFDKKPLWGMPYGLPGLSLAEHNTLNHWLQKGAGMALAPEIGPAARAAVAEWEAFLNGDSLKQQLMSRYLYEHWFLANLHFPGVEDGRFFRVVRSTTPPGKPIDIIASRRPYDDPEVERPYYRIVRLETTTLDKTHMPYALDDKRKALLRELFLNDDIEVKALPSYAPEVAANPFVAFKDFPVDSRWRFLLEEAQFTVMNFIKGPVCRGQVALSVIRDRFWVVFSNPEFEMPGFDEAAFLSEQEANLRIPVQAGSNASPFSTWAKYSKAQDKYLKAKADAMQTYLPDGKYLTLDLIWDGDGDNQNAALTIFRHFDSASVVKGFVGGPPNTAWLVDYPILERIHYLLVAGFDVFGNMGHQLTTRLYMDFLRLEGEFNFLALLPPETRKTESEAWYAGASKKAKSYIYGTRANFTQPTGIEFQTDDPKLELYGMMEEKLAPVLNHDYDLDHPDVPAAHRESLQRMSDIMGLPVYPLPEVVYLNVQPSSGGDYYYTLLHDNARNNITSLFTESKHRVPEADHLTVVRDFIASYPSAYWRVAEKDLPALVEQMEGLSDEASYRALMDRYGVRRTSEEFWAHSDKIMKAHFAADPLNNALLDYNRLENR